jgi:hypothetical protein
MEMAVRTPAAGFKWPIRVYYVLQLFLSFQNRVKSAFLI